jgi:repressor LexA
LRYVQQRLLGGQPPTVREVQAAFGFRAVQTAREHLEKLVAEGKLTHRRGRARSYGLPAPSKQLSRWVPLLGAVQAGALEQAIADPQGYVSVQTRGRAQLFALRVRGHSMTGAGILPGDTVIVRAQPTAQTGDIVVALVEDEATVKRLRVHRGRAQLHPENPNFAPIVPDRPWTILGKVIEVRRQLEA